MKNPLREDERIVKLMKMTRQPTKHLVKKMSEIPSKEPRKLDPMILEDPRKGEGIQVEI